jgi:uncharacterized protein with PIN domain
MVRIGRSMIQGLLMPALSMANNSHSTVILECTDCRHKQQAVQASLKRCGKCGLVLRPVEKRQAPVGKPG